MSPRVQVAENFVRVKRNDGRFPSPLGGEGAESPNEGERFWSAPLHFLGSAEQVFIQSCIQSADRLHKAPTLPGQNAIEYADYQGDQASDSVCPVSMARVGIISSLRIDFEDKIRQRI